MSKKTGLLIVLALALALVLAASDAGSALATTGTFCSPLAPMHSQLSIGVPNTITFTSGPSNVTEVEFFLWSKATGWLEYTASDITRVTGTNGWTASVSVDAAAGEYYSWVWIGNPVGWCGFKYGTVEVVSSLQ
jgi:ABC-type enterobactin transport system permease subunit